MKRNATINRKHVGVTLLASVKKIRNFALILSIAVATIVSAQTPGQLDPSFNTTGYYTTDFGFHDNLNHILVQPDQKIVSTGVALNAAYMGGVKVIRQNADGSPDLGFANAGVFTFSPTDAETYGIISQVTSDGKILVGGIYINTTTYYADFLLIRLNADGSLDNSFGTNGMVITDASPMDDLLQGMALQDDGRIVISGTVSEVVGFDIYNAPCLMRFTADGQVDPSFGTAGLVKFATLAADNELTSCLVQPDGKILASGHYQDVFTGATNFDVLLVRVDQTGVPDPLFGTNGMVIQPIFDGIDDAFGMDIDPDGNIYVGGFTTMPVSLDMDMVLLKFDSNGTPVSTFGTDGVVFFNNGVYDVAMDVKIQPDNKVILCGASGGGLFEPRSLALWRYNSDGTPDTGFGNNGFSATEIFPGNMHEFNSLAIQADGRIVAAGKAQAATNNDIVVARYFSGLSIGIIELPDAAFRVYPNHSAGTITIVSSEDFSDGFELTLYSTDGRPVLKRQFAGAMVSFDTFLASGLYIWEIRNRHSQSSGKISILNK